jgi:hypothetical protein
MIVSQRQRNDHDEFILNLIWNGRYVTFNLVQHIYSMSKMIDDVYDVMLLLFIFYQQLEFFF